MEKLKNKDLQRISIEEFKNSRKTPITIVLDNVRSSLNVGSVFRTADAFLIEKLISNNPYPHSHFNLVV